MIVRFVNRIIGGTIGGGFVGCSVGFGSLKNNVNEIKFKRFKEYRELPYHGAKVGAVIGGSLYGLYPIVVPYLAYKIGKQYELSRGEIQVISRDLGTSHVYELMKLNAKIIIDQIKKT
jgi:hypothetical protein